MKLLQSLLGLHEDVQSPQLTGASVRKIGSGYDAYFVFNDKGRKYQVTPTSFTHYAKVTDGETFLAHYMDEESDHNSVFDFPISGPYGQEIVSQLEEMGYDVSHCKVRDSESDYTDTRMRQGERGVTEGVKRVDSFENGNQKAVVVYDNSVSEYTVKFYVDGKHNQDADYSTDDKNDAIGTAKHQLKIK